MTYCWQHSGLTPEQQADAVVKEMTEQEKYAWLSAPMAIPFDDKMELPKEAIGSAAYYPGIPRLGIPAMQQCDASLGVSVLGGIRPGEHATALPSSLTLAATFNPDIAEQTGAMLGQEAHAKGFNVQLAGGVGLIREPRCGRNFEYLSEDPLLSGILAGHSVRGIQSQHIVSTVKHYAVNSQETGRVLANSLLSEAAMRESDLLAFELAIEIGQPGSVMPGYNLINGHWASENDFLLNQVLKGDWKYPGWVMSDWGATHSAVKPALAGLDVQSGANLDKEFWFDQPLREAVARGEVPAERIDDMVRRILRSLFACGAIQNPAQRGSSIDFSAHKLIAQREAEQGIVLLKNTEQLLPLPRELKKILVVGANADQGVPAGGGSSAVTPIGSIKLPGVDFLGLMTPKVYHPASPLLAIRYESLANEVEYLSGEDVATTLSAARQADAVIIFAEEWRAEALDAQGLALSTQQNQLIDALAEVQPKTVVVLETGGPVTMPWLDKVPAVLEAWYSGSAGGDAIAGILFGRVNPGGRLPITFPASEQQLPRPEQTDPETTTSWPGAPVKGGVFDIDHDIEGSDVGYRWFERSRQQPLFPFGFGLSYTTFTYHDLVIATHGSQVVVSFKVKNSGERTGDDVPQVYIRPLSGVYPARLAGFKRVQLAAGDEQTVSIVLEPRIIASWSNAQSGWEIAAGEYQVAVSSDAQTPVLTETLSLGQQQFGYPEA